MKRTKNSILALLLVFLISGLMTGCTGVRVEGSGTIVTETFNFSDFTNVEVRNGLKVELIESSTFKVELIVDDNVLEHINVNKSGDTLRIIPKSNTAFRNATLSARINMPELKKLELSGGSHATITGFKSSNDFSVKLSGGSHVTRGDITAGNVIFNLSGGSHVTLSGSANDIEIKGSDGSHITLTTFSVRNADVNLSGGSHATVNVDGTLNVDISGGSEVVYIGEPTMGEQDVAWDSELTKK